MVPEENLPVVYGIVLNWNGKQDTLECLISLRQSNCFGCHIILVDNGSIDGTVDAVRAQFPDVHIILGQSNLGFAEGNNIGIRYALENDAEYVFLLNNDTTIKPLTLMRLIEVAERDPQIGILCPTIVSYVDRTKSYVGARIYWQSGTVSDIEQSPERLPGVLDTDYAPGCAFLIKTSVIRQIGLLDPYFFAYFEDVDWSLRCRRAGYRVVVVPQATVYHKGTMDQAGRKSPEAEFYFRRNQFLFMRKYAKWYYWIPFFKNNTRKSLERFQYLAEVEDWQHAEALLDGWWAGMNGSFGAQRSGAPGWFKKFVQTRLNLLMWLTGWLYFWDYQKAKRQRAKETPTSV